MIRRFTSDGRAYTSPGNGSISHADPGVADVVTPQEFDTTDVPQSGSSKVNHVGMISSGLAEAAVALFNLEAQEEQIKTEKLISEVQEQDTINTLNENYLEKLALSRAQAGATGAGNASLRAKTTTERRDSLQSIRQARVSGENRRSVLKSKKNLARSKAYLAALGSVAQVTSKIDNPGAARGKRTTEKDLG